jgi:hypothetical protein
MDFKAMQMHCPGDEKIIPLYRPENNIADSKIATTMDVE